MRLATVGDLATARVLVARLASEGIESRLHGDPLGPYPVTVGALAETQIWVLSDRIEEASTLLLDAEVNDTLHTVDGGRSARHTGLSLPWKITAGMAAAVLAVLYALRVASVY